ncbi:MAG: hypothetical protein H6647_06745 [Anaerolineales bacterium]|nr:hypothetical protein [Anaerolineales bacterium]
MSSTASCTARCAPCSSCALFPLLCRRHVAGVQQSGRRARRVRHRLCQDLKLFLAISLLIGLAFTFLADPLVELLLGENIDLNTAAAVLALLGWVIVLYFPNWLYGVTLVALGRQKLERWGSYWEPWSGWHGICSDSSL